MSVCNDFRLRMPSSIMKNTSVLHIFLLFKGRHTTSFWKLGDDDQSIN